MQFTKQTITILNRQGKAEEWDVMVGEDTGLGYYGWTNGLVITTTQSGYAVANLWNLTTLSNMKLAYNEQVAQQFIKNIMHLLDWKNSYEQIMEQAKFCYGDMQAIKPHIRKAFSDACEQVTAVEASK